MKLIPENLDGLLNANNDGETKKQPTRRVADAVIHPRKGGDTVLIPLEPLRPAQVHKEWSDEENRYFTFACENDCLVCKAGNKATPALLGRTYLVDDDQVAVVLLPMKDSSQTKYGLGLKALQKVLSDLPEELVWRTPFALSLEETDSGTRLMRIEPDGDMDGHPFSYEPNAPEAMAASAARAELEDLPLLRPFSMDLDGHLLPKLAGKIRRRLSRERS